MRDFKFKDCLKDTPLACKLFDQLPMNTKCYLLEWMSLITNFVHFQITYNCKKSYHRFSHSSTLLYPCIGISATSQIYIQKQFPPHFRTSVNIKYLKNKELCVRWLENYSPTNSERGRKKSYFLFYLKNTEQTRAMQCPLQRGLEPRPGRCPCYMLSTPEV